MFVNMYRKSICITIYPICNHTPPLLGNYTERKYNENIFSSVFEIVWIFQRTNAERCLEPYQASMMELLLRMQTAIPANICLYKVINRNTIKRCE